MSILCRFGWHRWGKWTDYKQVTVQYRKTLCGVPMTDWQPYGEKIVQMRKCECCGTLAFQDVIVKTTGASEV